MQSDTVPQIFKTICKVAGLNDNKINESWEKILKKAYLDFTQWLINDAGLSESQKEDLATADLQIFLSNLDKKKKEEIANKLAYFMTYNLASFYQANYENKSFEQKQVIDALIITK